jgi:hypothetical protein
MKRLQRPAILAMGALTIQIRKVLKSQRLWLQRALESQSQSPIKSVNKFCVNYIFLNFIRVTVDKTRQTFKIFNFV